MCKGWRLGLFALLASSLHAQFAMTAAQVEIAQKLFTQPSREAPLECHVQTFAPFLDFAFRFEAGYTVRLALRQFKGEADTLYTFLRITPQGGTPILLGESYAIPRLPAILRHRVNLSRLSEEAELSGAFAMGEGEYHVELLVIDAHRRAFSKSWNTTAAPHHGEREAAIAMEPNTAGSATTLAPPPDSSPEPPPVQRETGGLRLTVLLHASPIQGIALRAWDSNFLLESLSSLLADLPSSSVRLIAFNLDQQKELFRQENFRRSDFPSLAAALRKLELHTVSYRTLQNQRGWSELLARLVNEEATAPEPPDAVVFLGPHSRFDGKVPREMLRLEGATPRLFYFEYFARWGSDFPDSLHHLTDACSGTVLKLHSPAELAGGIRKMQRILKDSGLPSVRAAVPLAP